MKAQPTMTPEQEAEWVAEHEPYRDVAPPPLTYGRSRRNGLPPAIAPTFSDDRLAEWRMYLAAGTLDGSVQGPELPTAPRATGIYSARVGGKHGTTSTYVAGCRCAPCRLARSDYDHARYRTTHPRARRLMRAPQDEASIPSSVGVTSNSKGEGSVASTDEGIAGQKDAVSRG